VGQDEIVGALIGPRVLIAKGQEWPGAIFVGEIG
jgi:hypothetical protein